MKCPSYDMFFSTISNKTRMQIVELLMKRPMNVTEICEATGQEQSLVSHSLVKLTQCHFVESSKKGKQRIYSLNTETIVPLMELVEKHVKKYCNEQCKTKGAKDETAKTELSE